MSSGTKRAFSQDEGSISPPPIKRKPTEDDFFGSGSSPTPPDNHLRIYSWNVNGIGPFLQRPLSFAKSASFRSPLRTFLARHNWPHILCFQEVKINPKDIATQRALQNAANLDPSISNDGAPTSSTPTYTTHFSLPRDKYNAIGFGGKVHGVATLIRDDLRGCLKIPRLTTTTHPVPWDLEGRVLITTLSIPRPSASPTPDFPPSIHLHILHAYWPNGTTNPYRSPTTGLHYGTRHDHKLRFHTSMLSEALTLQSQSHVLLIGDMNIAPTALDGHPNLRTSPTQHILNRKDFNDKFLDQENQEGFRGVDVWRFLRGRERKYTYYPRGRQWGSSCDRVDLIIVGPGMVGRVGKDGQGPGEGCEKDAVVSMEIYDNELDRSHSDHVPMGVTLDLGKLAALGETSSE
jgi:exonuclease III